MAPAPRRSARAAAWIATVLWLFVLTGLFFHHSAEPVVLGRFSKTYALGLLVLALLTPVLFLLTRSVFSPSFVARPGGTTLVISPLSKVLIIVLSTLFAFGIAQLVLPRRLPYRYRHHPFLQAVPAPDAAKGVNSRGFRGREPAVPKPPGLFRLLLLGGSTTFDPELEYEATYGRQLERLLQETLGPKQAEVQCAAVPGYNSEHSLVRYAADAIELDSDVVLVMHAVNDLHVAAQPPSIFRRDYGHFGGIGKPMLHPGFVDRTRVLDFIQFFAQHVAFSDFRRPDDFDAEGVVPDPGPLLRNLRSIAVLGRSRGQQVVLCTQPHTFRLDVPAEHRLRGDKALRNFLNGEPLPGFVWFSRYMGEFNARIRALAAQEGLPLLDLESAVPPTEGMFNDDVHVTAAGARLEAEIATRFLVTQRLVR